MNWIREFRLLVLWGAIWSGTWMYSNSQSTDAELTEDNDGNENVHSLFRDYEDKKTTIWKCDGWHGGMKWRIPQSLECSLSTELESNKVVAVTLYWPDISKQTVQGYECYGEKTEGWIYRNFWEATTKETKTFKIAVNEKECWDMVHSKKSPDGRVLLEKSGVTGTFKTLSIKSSWWYNTSSMVTNYYFLPLKVAVLELDSSVQATTIFKQPCMYHESYCLTDLGVLVWNVKDVKTCRLTEGENTRCVYCTGETSKRLTCPELELSIHDLHHVKLCNKTFGSSSQGYYFAQNSVGEYDNITVTPEEVRNHVSKPKGRSKREIAYDKKSVQDAFVNAKFNYLYEVVTQGTEHAIKKLVNDVCKANQRQLDSVRYMAETGHPTLITRFIFGDSSYRAAFSGDVLSVWQCFGVKSYKFLPREKCTLEWPISYIKDSQVQHGFLAPLSHTIRSIPTIMPEPCSEYYFDTGSKVYHLSNSGAMEVHLPSLPKPGDDHKNLKLFPPLSFKSSSGFDITSVTDVGHSYTMLREVQAKQNHLDSLIDRVDVIEAPLTPLRFIFTTVTAFFSALPTFVKYLLGFASAFLTIALVVFCALNIGVFMGIFYWLSKPISGIFSYLKAKVSKKSEERKSKRKHKQNSVPNDHESNTNQDYRPSAPKYDDLHFIEESNAINRREKRNANQYPY